MHWQMCGVDADVEVQIVFITSRNMLVPPNKVLRAILLGSKCCLKNVDLRVYASAAARRVHRPQGLPAGEVATRRRADGVAQR